MIYVYVWGSWKRYWPWKIKKNIGLDFNKKASNYMPPKSCHFSDKATVMECRKIWVPAMLVWKPCTFCYWLYWTANDKQLRPPRLLTWAVDLQFLELHLIFTFCVSPTSCDLHYIREQVMTDYLMAWISGTMGLHLNLFSQNNAQDLSIMLIQIYFSK